jgi:hypothetical protein
MPLGKKLPLIQKVNKNFDLKDDFISVLYFSYCFKVTCLNGETLNKYYFISLCILSQSGSEPDSKDNSVLKNTSIFPSLPGIYMILCTVNNFRYYGQTSSLARRISSHKSLLKRKIHPNYKLQNDFNNLGLNSLQFSILYVGENWEDEIIRKRKEVELILKDIDFTYNIYKDNSPAVELNPFWKRLHSEKSKKQMSESSKDIPNVLLGKAIKIPSFKTRKSQKFVESGTFPSIAEAARQTQVSRQFIRARVNSPEYPEWYWVQKSPELEV